MNVEELEEVVAEWESLVQICPIVLTVIFNVIIFDWAARTVEKSVIVELWKDLKHYIMYFFILMSLYDHCNW